MLIQSVHFTFAGEDADTAQAMLRERRETSRKEEGVVAFDVARSRDKPNVFALWEQYRDGAVAAGLASIKCVSGTVHPGKIVLELEP